MVGETTEADRIDDAPEYWAGDLTAVDLARVRQVQKAPRRVTPPHSAESVPKPITQPVTSLFVALVASALVVAYGR
jgi:hypothetical protein